MMYKVVSYRTRTFCKVFAVPELYDQPIIWGTWKTLRHAKKVRARLNKDRTETVDVEGLVTDHGPAFRNVQIVEVNNE